MASPYRSLRPIRVNGERLAGCAVIDGRGARDSAHLVLGYQKFLGREVRLARPHGLAGPIVMDAPLAGAASLTPGRVDHLLATIDFPSTAGDAHKNKVSELAFRFTAVQRDGAAR